MKKLRFFSTLLATTLTLTLFSPISAQAYSLSDDRVVRVGYFTAYTDLISDIDSINKKGYGYEVFQKMEEYSNFKFEFVAIDGSITDAIDSGYVDVAGFMIKTPTREENYIFSDTPYSKTYSALMTDDFTINYNDPAAIDGKTVASYEDHPVEANLNSYCETYGISVEYVYDNIDSFTDLDTDFSISFLEDRSSAVRNNALNLGVFNMYLVTSLENRDLMDMLDGAMLQIISAEGNFFFELEEKYLAQNIEVNHRSLGSEEKAALSSRAFSVGYIDNHQPLSYTDENGNAAGTLVDVFNNFVDKYDMTVTYHPYNINDDINSYKDYDILLTLYGDRDVLTEHYQYTDQLFALDMYTQVQGDIYDPDKTIYELLDTPKNIGVANYLWLYYDVFEETFPGTNLIYLDDFQLGINGFKNKDLDMLITTETALSYIETTLEGHSHETVKSDMVNPVRILVSNELADTFIPIFNVMVDRVSESQYSEMVERSANAFFYTPSAFDVIWDYWYIGVLIGLIIILGFIAFGNQKQKEKDEAVEYAHTTDSLTGFMAIHTFRELLAERLTTMRPFEYEIISLDVDMFRTINTHFSSQRGTDVIKAIATGLDNALGKTDAVITRRTADQFLILRRVNIGGTVEDIYRQDVLPAIRETIGEKYNICMSFGTVIIDNCKDKSTSIIAQADQARTAGKNEHRTTFITFDEEMLKQYEDKINITFRMEQALKDREFFVVYQPKIDFKTMNIGGAEALVRWQPRLSNMIYPDQFIPIFEQNGFISDLDMYVFEEVCKYINRMSGKLHLPVISVNLSAHTVLSDNILQRITSIITNYNVKKDQVEFELTESAVESNSEKFLATVKQFKKLGYLISIDDFGAGVSSLNRLSSIDADILKMDKAFFDLKTQGGKSSVVVTNVIRMAKELGMKVVAEGVETAAQALWLNEIGCDYAQGYYFSKPLSEADFTDVLKNDTTYNVSIA